MQHDADPIAALLYEGALDPDRWVAGLDTIRRATGGGLFYHFTVDTRSMAVVQSCQNEALPPDTVREYEQHHAQHDERLPLVMGLAVGEPMFDNERFTPRELSRSFIYNDWLPSIGYRHTFSVPLLDTGDTRDFLTVVRPVDHRAWGSKDRQLIEQVMPDLLRATRLRHRMAATAGPAALGIAGLDVLPQAVAVVDARCKVHYLNAPARRTLEGAGHGLTVRRGRLSAAHPPAQAALAAQVAAACTPLPRAGSVCVPHTGPGLWLNVLPLQATHPLAAWHRGEPMALLAWLPPDTGAAPAQLADLLGLTETEARLALALSQGLSIKDFALAQGCSWHTTRTHLRNLLRKTGCHRQADLVQLVRNIQA
jgi:DNA-binding CsgD family transcriptional regulator